MIKKERKRGKVILFFYISVSEPPHFRRLRLRLLVNCKAENYEFVTTKKKIIFFPDTKLQNLHVRLQEQLFVSGKKTGFWIRIFLRIRIRIRILGVSGGGGWGVVVKGKNDFFFSFFFTFQMILNIAHLLLYKIMIYSFLSLPFWPGSGSANLCGSGSETLEENNFFQLLRIHTELTCSTLGATFCIREENNFLKVVLNSQFSALQFTRSRSRSRNFVFFSAPAPAPAKKAGSGRLRLRLRNTGKKYRKSSVTKGTYRHDYP